MMMIIIKKKKRNNDDNDDNNNNNNDNNSKFLYMAFEQCAVAAHMAAAAAHFGTLVNKDHWIFLLYTTICNF